MTAAYRISPSAFRLPPSALPARRVVPSSGLERDQVRQASSHASANAAGPPLFGALSGSVLREADIESPIDIEWHAAQ